jgi:hypothetical protein
MLTTVVDTTMDCRYTPTPTPIHSIAVATDQNPKNIIQRIFLLIYLIETTGDSYVLSARRRHIRQLGNYVGGGV